MTRDDDDDDGDGMTAWGEGGARGGGTWWYRESARAVEAKTRVGVGVGRTWDVVATSAYVKVNAPPRRLCYVDLFDDIDEETVTVSYEAPDVVIFHCWKRVKKLWGQLHRDGDKDAILRRRAASLCARDERVRRLDEEAETRKKRIAREFLQRQWDEDDARKQQHQEHPHHRELSCVEDASSALKPRRTTRLRAPRPATGAGAATSHHQSRAPPPPPPPPPPRAFIHVPVTLTRVERLPARTPLARSTD